ncbi:metallopeptidase family protein [Aliiroseovarius sp. F20344]|uniref:metallopeptidase family protein n=1 Tax=Aliiroseovarius sp. F20344 TaxID=2926414 RepID=UPI001FF0EC72|nr:metallopeptidase family protein [Aliiroseovarius sp. F20344]MCK0141899.1 metallopeptidase family protein [Aliiroseovarius sp. F20344]
MENSSAPSLAQIEQLALEARAHLPDPFAEPALDVGIHVAEIPDASILADHDIADPYELTGMYVGVPLTEKVPSDQPLSLDAIWLFRRPILDELARRGDVTISELVTHIVVHEFAHHFGWTDEQIAAIDHWWE